PRHPTASRGPTTTSSALTDSFGIATVGTDRAHRDNAGLREAMRRQLPLVYFHGIVPGRYMASWPVFIVDDDPHALTFSVAVDDRQLALATPILDTPEVEIRR